MPVMKCALCSKLCSQQCVCRKVAYCNDTCQKLAQLTPARLEKAQDELPSNGGSGNLH